MSALPRHPRDSGYTGLRMSADEYLALGQTPDRYELIDGVVFMSPSPTPLHQLLLQEIAVQLTLASREPGGGFTTFLDTDVRFAPALVYCPDVSVYRPGRLKGTPAQLTIVPDLVVEVLSPGNRPLDLVTKRGDYEQFGVGEYWVLDPDTGDVRCWRRRAGRYEESPVTGGTLPSDAIPGFTLDLVPLRRLVGAKEA